MKQKAFTLLEILLVIAAIGILAAIVIVAINPQRQLEQARTSDLQSSINTVHKALQQYLINQGKLPDDITSVMSEICATGDQTPTQSPIGSDCLDLRALVPTYLAVIPESPYESNETGLYTWINQDNGRIALYGVGSTNTGISINQTGSLVQDGLITHLDTLRDESYPGTGLDLFDLSESVYYDTLVNGVTYNSGERAFSFNGSNGYIRLDDALKNDLSTSDLSISIWLKKSDREETIIGFISNASTTGSNYFLGRQRVGLQNFRITDSVNSSISWEGYHDRWVNLSITFDTTLKIMKIYFDGELRDEIDSSTSKSLDLSAANLDIGRDGRGNEYYNGLISTIIIYDKELTPEEVKQNHIGAWDQYQ